MSEEKQVIRLDYTAPTVGRIFSSFFFDYFISIVLGLVILIGGLFALNAMPFYQDATNKRNEIQIASHLYVSSDDSTKTLSSYLGSNDELSYSEKIERLSSSLSYFFDTYLGENTEVAKPSVIYTELLVKQKGSNGEKLFDENRNRIETSSSYDVTYYDMYSAVLDEYALGYLGYVPHYLEYRRTYILSYIITIVICFVIAFTIVFYVFPMIFNTGKRTPGMLIDHLAYVQANGFSVSNLRYTLRYLFQLVFIILASTVTFLIPLGISIGMLFFSKHHQPTPDYVTGCYLVLNEDTIIYKDMEDYQRIQELRKRTSAKEWLKEEKNKPDHQDSSNDSK